MGFPTFTPINTFNQGQVDQASQDYGQQHQAAISANQNLQDYQKSMVDPSQMYQTNLDKTNQSIGFDPKQLAAANQQLGVTQNQMANLPQAIAAQGGGYGVTAGQMSNNYNQSIGNLHTALADQGNNVNALQSTYQNALKQAGDQTNFGVQGQQMKLQSYKDIFDNAQALQQSSLQNMQFLEDQFQKQGQFNSDQARQYAASYAQYQQALAAANAANAQAGLFSAQAAQSRYTLQGAQQVDAASQAQAAQKAAADRAAQLQQASAIRNYQSSYTPGMFDSMGDSLSAVGNAIGGGIRSLFGAH